MADDFDNISDLYNDPTLEGDSSDLGNGGKNSLLKLLNWQLVSFVVAGVLIFGNWVLLPEPEEVRVIRPAIEYLKTAIEWRKLGYEDEALGKKKQATDRIYNAINNINEIKKTTDKHTLTDEQRQTLKVLRAELFLDVARIGPKEKRKEYLERALILFARAKTDEPLPDDALSTMIDERSAQILQKLNRPDEAMQKYLAVKNYLSTEDMVMLENERDLSSSKTKKLINNIKRKSSDVRLSLTENEKTQLNERIASTLEKLGRLSEAKAYLLRFLEEQPSGQEDVRLWLRLGDMEKQLSKETPSKKQKVHLLKAALRHYIRGIKRSRDITTTHESHFSAGKIQYLLGNYADAISHFEDSKGLLLEDPYDPEAGYWIGLCIEKQGNKVLARSTWEATLNQFPKHKILPSVMLCLAESFFAKGENIYDGIGYLFRITQYLENSKPIGFDSLRVVELLENAADMLRGTHKYRDAIEIYEHLIENYKVGKDTHLKLIAEDYAHEADSIANLPGANRLKREALFLKSARTYLRIVKEAPNSNEIANALWLAAKMLEKSGPDKTIANVLCAEALNSFGSQFPSDSRLSEAWYRQAESLARLNNLTGALKIHTKNCAAHPLLPWGILSQVRRAEFMRQLGGENLENAISEFDKVLDDRRITPKSLAWMQSLFGKGIAEFDLARHKQVLGEKENEDDIAALFEQSIKSLNEARLRYPIDMFPISRDPIKYKYLLETLYRTHYILARSNEELGRHAQGRFFFEKVIGDRYPESLIDSEGATSFKTQNSKLARKQAVLGKIESYYAEAQQHRSAGRTEEMKSLMDKTLTAAEDAKDLLLRDPEGPWLYYRIARCYSALGDEQQAKRNDRFAENLFQTQRSKSTDIITPGADKPFYEELQRWQREDSKKIK